MAMDGEVVQRQHFSHHGDTIRHPKSGFVIIIIIEHFFLHHISSHCDHSEAHYILKQLHIIIKKILAAAKHWQFIPKWKYGSTVEFTSCRVQDFLSD